MDESDQQKITVAHADALLRVLSRPRFQTYMAAAGYDIERAWRLYLWNARLGEAFHLPIQVAEVGFRNCIDLAFSEALGPNWGVEQSSTARLEVKIQDDLTVVRRRIENRRQRPEHAQVIAGLSFGFWVQLLQRRYTPLVWSKYLRLGFPHLPSSIDLQTLHDRAFSINGLRNRISHHEPILKLNVSKRHSEIVELIGWICPTTLGLCRGQFTLPKVMRAKP